jgi:hypothetical protein
VNHLPTLASHAPTSYLRRRSAVVGGLLHRTAPVLPRCDTYFAKYCDLAIVELPTDSPEVSEWLNKTPK